MLKLNFVLYFFVFFSNKIVNSVENLKDNLNSSPVKFKIVGDTSHLFAPEDFEKIEVKPLHNLTSNETKSSSKEKAVNATCLCKNFDLGTNSVKIVNGSSLTKTLHDSSHNECFVVLFYVPWCPFSAKLAPYFNALPRAFPHLDFLAFDVSKSIGYNTKFGTSAVPMIILFQQRNVLSKFNYTSKVLKDYIHFFSNKTGMEAHENVTLNESDYEGPVSSEPVIETDYYLWLAWIFLIIVSIDQVIKKTNLKHSIEKYFRLFILFFRPIRLTELGEPVQFAAIENNTHPHND